MHEEKITKTKNRIKIIKENIEFHKKSIQMLNEAFERCKFEFQMGYRKRKDRIVSFKSIPFSEKRYKETLNNIRNQIVFLERELITLNNYGL